MLLKLNYTFIIHLFVNCKIYYEFFSLGRASNHGSLHSCCDCQQLQHRTGVKENDTQKSVPNQHAQTIISNDTYFNP